MALQFRTAKRWMTKRVIPDYTNQLALFSEAAPDTSSPVVNAPPRVSGVSSAPPRPPEQMRFLEWEPLPPEDAVRAKPAPPSIGRNGRAVQQLLLQPDTDARTVTTG